MNLKQIRMEKGLTVQQLADSADLPKRTVENILRNGDCLVSNAIKLADALGVTLDELFPCFKFLYARLSYVNHDIFLVSFHSVSETADRNSSGFHNQLPVQCPPP